MRIHSAFMTTLIMAALGCGAGNGQPSGSVKAGSQAVATDGSIPAAERPPTALLQLGDSAERLFNAAYASDWTTADEALMSMNEARESLPLNLRKPDIVAELRTRVHDVRQSVPDRNRADTMAFANAITRLVDEVASEYQRQVPYEAVMLGYFGRQLELGVTTDQRAALHQATADLRDAWNRLEPEVERRHPDDARQFTDIVVTLEGARRPGDYVAPVHAELAEAERIEGLFKS